MESEFYPKSRAEWRRWLRKNHLQYKHIAVIRYKKHTGKESPSHLELMHEAICWGWIDTTIKRIDSEKYAINFRPRNDKSKWSTNTLSYGKKMIAEGKMSKHGLKMYLEGVRKGAYNEGEPKIAEMPKELRSVLEKKGAYERFMSFSNSYKQTLLRWLSRAKLPDTRKRRIEVIVERAIQNKRRW